MWTSKINMVFKINFGSVFELFVCKQNIEN